jgi:hypothetical protein
LKTTDWITLHLVLFLAATVGWAQESGPTPSQEAQNQRVPEFVWKQSLPIRWGEAQITAIGGTELRELAVFDKKLFAGNGYWMDTEAGNSALPGAQVLRLDSSDSQWQVDLELTDRTPLGLRLYMAISTLEKVRFTTDSAGQPLTDPVDFLLAGVWKRGIGLDLFSRTTDSGWSKTSFPGQENAPRGTQIRAFALHRDQITGSDVVFAGVTNAIFAGMYDRQSRNIVWNSQSEWRGHFSDDPDGPKGRVACFAECDGKLFAAAYDTVYERVDGKSPAWKKVFGTTIHAQSNRVTGFRGLTCIHGPSGSGDVLLVGVEDNPSRIYRIDPREVGPSGECDGILELDVSAFLTKALGTKTTYAIVAYNNMAKYPDPATGPNALIGFEADTPGAPQNFGGRHEPNGYYLVRDSNGGYVLREIRDFQIEPKPKLESVRTIGVSPFQSDPPGTVYAGGFDTDRNPVHNTAWLYKGVPAAGIPLHPQ